MLAIRITPNPAEPIELIDVADDFRSLAAAIGGPCEYIEIFKCPLTPTYGLVGVLDETGQYNGQPVNQRAWPLYPLHNYELRGTVLVMAEGLTPGGYDLIDLPNTDLAMQLVADLLEGAHRG